MRTAIQVADSVQISGDLTMDEPSRLFAGCSVSNSHIGAFSYVSPGTSLHKVTIGRYCSIGDGVKILSQHPHDTLTTSPFPYQRIFQPPFDADPVQDYAHILPTRIGNDVWIGSGAKIKCGITIGDGAIIGAGAVVTRDVAPFHIVGGVPAKLIRLRFSKQLIARINQLAWWHYNLIGAALNWQDPQATLDQIQNQIQTGHLQPHHAKTFKIFTQEGRVHAQLLDRDPILQAGR